MVAQDSPIKITDCLYLGNFNAASYSNLVNNGIGSVVCVTRNAHAYPDDIKLLHINDISENLDTDSFSIFKLIRAVDFIQQNISLGLNVLVHCKAGASRSPTVIIAYIMQTQGLNLTDAITFVVEKAPYINLAFPNLLKEYQRDFCAIHK